MGAGQGFERGAQSISNSVMSGIRLGLQQKRNDQLNELYTHAIDYNLEWKRGIDGLPPSYTEEEEAEQAAATRPTIPSSTPITTPGPLGIPQTTFPVGKAVQPMPSAAPKAPGGAMGLLPPSMRPPSLRMLPGMRRRY